MIDRAPLKQGESHSYSVTATGDGPLVVTLVWADWPGYPGAVKSLINDLDLRVTGPKPGSVNASDAANLASSSGSPAGASATATNATTWWGNGGSSPDRANNVEKVWRVGKGGGPLIHDSHYVCRVRVLD